jgi:iron complex transport system permease protein
VNAPLEVAVDTVPEPAVVARVAAVARASARRRLVVGSVLAVAVLAVAALSLTTGDLALTLPQLADALRPGGDVYARFVLVELRLPRLLLAACVGAAFALAGALFQSVLRNPLASPDIIGISQGASVGAVVAILALGWSGYAVAGSAFAGALAVAALNLLIGWGNGFSGYRFVLCGIGLAFVSTSVLSYLLTRHEVREAQSVLVWMAGSVSSADHDAVQQLGLALLVLLPLGLLLARGLELLEMGEDSAATLGVRPGVVRVGALVVGVAAAAAATALAGPVAFVALTAAPIARRLVGDGRVSVLPTVLVGVLIVTLADFVAQHLVPGRVSVPVGIVTGLLGGPYLVWLLATSSLTRRSR